MLKERKIELVDELARRLKEASTLIVADYRGLSVDQMQELRGELYSHGAKLTVVKNTLTLRAAEKAGVEELNDFLTGPTAIAFITDGDMVATAKALVNTAKETKVLSLKGGILDGRKIEAEDVAELAKLPAFDVLQGTVVGVIAAPLTHIVSLLAAPLRDIVGVLDARQRQLEEQGDAAPAETAAASDQDADDSDAGPSEPGASAEDAPASEPAAEGEGDSPPEVDAAPAEAAAEPDDHAGDAEAPPEPNDTDESQGKEEPNDGDN